MRNVIQIQIFLLCARARYNGQSTKFYTKLQIVTVCGKGDLAHAAAPQKSTFCLKEQALTPTPHEPQLRARSSPPERAAQGLRAITAPAHFKLYSEPRAVAIMPTSFLSPHPPCGRIKLAAHHNSRPHPTAQASTAPVPARPPSVHYQQIQVCANVSKTHHQTSSAASYWRSHARDPSLRARD